MRSSSVDVDAARVALAAKALTTRKVQESVAIHAGLGPVAIEMRLREIDREIAAPAAGSRPRTALLLAAFGDEGPTLRRRFLFSLAGLGLLTWLTAPHRPDTLRPFRSRELRGSEEIEQEREALLKLKHDLP